MISVEEALAFDRVQQYVRAVESDDVKDGDRSRLEYLDAVVEAGIYKDFRGEIFDLKIPVDFASQDVISALKVRYERGGWLVAIFVVTESGKEVAYQMVFAPARGVQKAIPEAPVADPPAPPKPRPKRERPTVLLVSDVPGWAFDVNMRDLAEYLAHRFEFSYFYTENWFKGERVAWDDYDVVYEAYHRNPHMGIPLSRAVGALRSEWFRPEQREPPTSGDVALVNRYRAFQVACRRNYDELIDRCPNIVYLTNPVNTRRFYQTALRDKIVASWNGNAGHKSPDGKYIKHYYDIVMPACLRAKVQIVAAEYGTKTGPQRRRAPAEMPEFYAQSNVALCASEYESASNSVMEAMASGLALIATDVGNHRELHDAQMAAYGDSGVLLVERDVNAFAAALRALTPARAREMGEINRKEIVERWSWEKWADRYQAFLEKAL